MAPIPAGDDQFFLPDSTPAAALMLNLATGIQWQGFGAGQLEDDIELNTAAPHGAGQFAFVGVRYLPGPTRHYPQTVLGLVDQNGVLIRSLRRDRWSGVQLFPANDQHPLVAVGDFGDLGSPRCQDSCRLIVFTLREDPGADRAKSCPVIPPSARPLC